MGWHQILLRLLLCFHFFMHASLRFASPLCPPDQRDALLHFKNSFMLDSVESNSCDRDGHVVSYPKTNSWNKGVDCCSWDGITCDGVTGNVIGLNLTCSRLHGALHSNSSLLLLRHLRSLNLFGNNFVGSHISPNLSTFASLTHLNLSSSAFSGTVPSEISHLSKLVSLDLSHNYNFDFYSFSFSTLRLENSILTVLVRNLMTLRKLVLDEVNMSMVSPKPFANLSSSLTYLSTSGCSLGGIFPDTVFRLPSLTYLDLSNNYKVSGILPKSNWTCPLESLSLWITSFSGEIPDSIGTLKSITILDLTECKFTGHVPSSLVDLKQLQVLCIGGNSFTGEIPSMIYQLSSLISLDLSNNSLSGNMPSCFGNITNLQYLHLSSNKLQGPLPRSLVKCVNLSTLALGGNEFSDFFPHWLDAPQLNYLDLQSNKFHGRINLTAFKLSFPTLAILLISNNNFTGRWPTEFFSNTSLYIMDLSNNKFGGPIPLPSPVTFYYAIASSKLAGKIPSLICNFARLEIIDLSNNNLTGSLPRCLTNFSTDLSVLNLRMNYLEGAIPRSFSSISSLTTLDLSRNRFEGTIPRSLVKCWQLEVLDLSDNRIEDTFPRWLGTLPELKVLVLRSNNLRDLLDIPRGAHIFPKLHILDLSNNNFSGPLPANLIMILRAIVNGENAQDESLYMTRFLGEWNTSTLSRLYENSVTLTMKGQEIELVKIVTFLTIIDLSNNSFQGDIPGVIGHLHSLVGLNLSHNHFTGSIPPTLGNLTNLGWLDLSSNKLSGAIPRKLGDLASLGYLNLSNNQLTGRIPQDKQLSTFSSDSFSGNPSLCGTPLQKACLGDAQPPPPSSSSTFDCEGRESWFKHKTMWIGYSSGLVIGISLAYIAFETERPKWLTRGVRMLERRAVEWTEKPKWKAIKFYGQ
ncbi:receptor-like protein 9DC3 [Syzygium oleosum]|uniref:receptor-like protein 9DC3 n=1 Tax=Syzygium oleosum TaxID=219896 RepID=UPI0024BA63CE|nr:receptor-like protein 9DC3 [Syzygium oleosum]